MSLSIHTNLMAGNTARNLGTNYSRLSDSIQRLSSGLRVNSASDDAAGLAIRELMRTDIAGLHQGVRNANDAISMLQTADGALAVIDEKLIRMKELAEQASTGTYDSTQRLIIDSEFQAMAKEIDRIANATDFNGTKLLDGSLKGEHDGSGLTSTGKMKVHFGTGNDSAEDYYYVDIEDCTLAGLGLRDAAVAGIATAAVRNGGIARARATTSGPPILSDVVAPGGTVNRDRPPNWGTFGIFTFGIIPAGTTDFSVYLWDQGNNDTIQLFTRDGKHIAGTTLDKWTAVAGLPRGATPPAAVTPADFMTEANGFSAGATYDGTSLNGTGNNILVDYENPRIVDFTVDGMNIGYTGDGNDKNLWPLPGFVYERLNIDAVTEDLIFIAAGYDRVDFEASWTDMPGGTGGPGPLPPLDPAHPPDPPHPPTDLPGYVPQGDVISIQTQDLAQSALERLDDAMVKKDGIRAHLGAMQNRLENTVTNLTIQAENLQAAESRISDVDVALEMTEFIRSQILAEAGTAMLAQANAMPEMLAGLLRE